METPVAIPPVQPPAPPPPVRKGAVESNATWALTDRIGLAICWALGLLFCAIAVAIVVYLFVQGIKFLRPSMLVTPATSGFTQTQTGGFSDAFFGTLIVATMGIAIAMPAGIAIAVWLVEFGRPAPLARVTESTIEAIAGIPSIVLALFGTVIFSNTALGFLSRTSERGRLRSLLLRRRRDALAGRPAAGRRQRPRGPQIDPPARARGLLRGRQDEGRDDAPHPAARPAVPRSRPGRCSASVASSATRRSSSSCSARPRTSPRSEGLPFPLDYLRGAGTTLTNFVYEASPTGNLNQPQKAYAAAFVLLLMVLGLNAAVDVVHRRSRKAGTWSS